VGVRFFTPVQHGPLVYPVSYTMNTRSFPVVNSRGVELTTHPYLKPRLRKSKIMPLFPICAFIASYRVKFTFIWTNYNSMTGKKCIFEPYLTSDYHHAISVNNNVPMVDFNSLFFTFIYTYLALTLKALN
jgi:hypothetical protein